MDEKEIPKGDWKYYHVTKGGKVTFSNDEKLMGHTEDPEYPITYGEKKTKKKHLGSFCISLLKDFLELAKHGDGEVLNIYYDEKTKKLLPGMIGKYVLAPRWNEED